MPTCPRAARGCSLFAAALTFLANASVRTQSPPRLLRDINMSPIPSPGSSPAGFVRAGSAMFFDSNRGLYRTNGTAAGTVGITTNVSYATNGGNGNLFYSFASPSLERRLWMTDDRATGGRLHPVPLDNVEAILPYRLGRRTGVVVDATDRTKGRELTFTDGTAGGTTTLDVYPGIRNSTFKLVGIARQDVYFVGTDGQQFGLWRTNFQPGGTVLVSAGAAISGVSSFTTDGNTAFFGATRGGIWQSNGTPASTRRIPGLPTTLTKVPKLAWTRRGLWVHDMGSPASIWHMPIGGTRLSAVTTSPVLRAEFAGLRATGDLVFSATDTTAGPELWISDGTPRGTRRLADIVPGTRGSSPQFITSFGPSVVFQAWTPTFGAELWATDGTAAGTRLVSDISQGAASSSPRSLTADPVSNTLWFGADDGLRGNEPWVLSATGTRLVADLIRSGPGSLGSEPGPGISLRTASGTSTIFTADDGIHGFEPWSTDGTTAGTRLLADLAPGRASSKPALFVRLHDRALFVASNWLYVTDGTRAGTRALRYLNLRSISPSLVSMGAYALFAASVSPEGTELWRTDGTIAGTRRLLDIEPGSQGSFPAHLTRLGHRAFFSARTSAAGRELWVTDGTVTGTRLVADLMKGQGPFDSSNPGRLTPLGERLVFSAMDTQFRHNLWITDGTAGGTRQVSNPALASNDPGEWLGTHDRVYFTVRKELWVTAGTPTSTTRLHASVAPKELTRLGSSVVFTGILANGHRELWITDGTPAGTRVLADLNGALQGGPHDLTKAGGRQVWFRTNHGTRVTLWRTDGTGTGTVPVTTYTDVRGRILGLGPRSLLVSANMNTNSTLGTELYALDLGAISEPIGLGCGSGYRTPTMDRVDCVLGQTATFGGSLLDRRTLTGSVALGAGRPIRYGSCAFFPGTGPLISLGPVALRGSTWQLAVPIPNDPRLLSAEFIAQAGFAVPPGPSVELSNGLRVVVGR